MSISYLDIWIIFESRRNVWYFFRIKIRIRCDKWNFVYTLIDYRELITLPIWYDIRAKIRIRAESFYPVEEVVTRHESNFDCWHIARFSFVLIINFAMPVALRFSCRGLALDGRTQISEQFRGATEHGFRLISRRNSKSSIGRPSRCNSKSNLNCFRECESKSNFYQFHDTTRQSRL